MYSEIIAVCSQIHTKHINTRCGQKVEFVNVKMAVPKVRTRLWRVELRCIWTNTNKIIVFVLGLHYIIAH